VKPLVWESVSENTIPEYILVVQNIKGGTIMKVAIRIVVALLVLIMPTTLLAQEYPTKTIRLFVGFPPGGGTDIAARLVAPELSKGLGQPVIVENRPGAGTNIAIDIVAKSAPDGYTLLLGTPPVLINQFLYKKVPFDALRDLVGVSLFSVTPNIMVVNSSSPVKSVSDFIALARSKPGHLTFSSSGNGTTQHLSGELFNMRAKVKTLHVPYRGTSPSVTALLSGEVDLSYISYPVLKPLLQAGKFRPLATTGATRTAFMPDLPTMKESGVDMEMVVWYGVFAPSGTPRKIIDKLAGLVINALNTPELRNRLLNMGSEPVGSTPDEFSKQLHTEVVQWEEVVKASGARVD
jgi:tripartite-type tricarboxylate transporter receptor subunit TctC